MSTDTLRNYLAWQAEMGTDEVILPRPRRVLVLRSAEPINHAEGNTDVTALRHSLLQGGAADRGAEAHSRGGTGGSLDSRYSGGPEADPVEPGKLFQTLARAMEKAEDKNKAVVFPTEKTAKPVETAPLPSFQSLEEFQSYMEKNLGNFYGTDATKGIPVFHGQGPVDAPLALVGIEPGEADATALSAIGAAATSAMTAAGGLSRGKIFQGEPGILLDKMLRAIRLEIPKLYLTTLLKVRISGKTWSRRELQRILPLLHAELGVAKAPVVLLLGEACAQTVLKTGKGIDELRQTPHRVEGREFVVTYHPEDLLRKEELKRKAWEDLKWLQKRLPDQA